MDWAFASASLLLPILLLFRWIPRLLRDIVAALFCVSGMLANGNTLFVLAIGYCRLQPFWLSISDWPGECASAWVGEPDWRLDYTNLDDPCIQRRCQRIQCSN